VKRLLAAVVIGSAVMVVSACGSSSHGEITYEMTGESGATADVTRVLPGQNGKPNSETFPNTALPMSQSASIGKGTFEVYGTPSSGALTCRIVLDGKEVAKQTGAPGQKVSCQAQVKG
jgi:hypothetical protein